MLGRTDSGRRLLLLLIVFVLAAGALVVRLGYWQVAQRDELVESARRQIYYRDEVPSRRGQIFDRSGTIILAASVTRDRLVVSAQNMTAAERAAMTAFLAAQLGLDEVAAAAVQAKLETGKPYLVIARRISSPSSPRRSRSRRARPGSATSRSSRTPRGPTPRPAGAPTARSRRISSASSTARARASTASSSSTRRSSPASRRSSRPTATPVASRWSRPSGPSSPGCPARTSA